MEFIYRILGVVPREKYVEEFKSGLSYQTQLLHCRDSLQEALDLLGFAKAPNEKWEDWRKRFLMGVEEEARLKPRANPPFID